MLLFPMCNVSDFSNKKNLHANAELSFIHKLAFVMQIYNEEHQKQHSSWLQGRENKLAVFLAAAVSKLEKSTEVAST